MNDSSSFFVLAEVRLGKLSVMNCNGATSHYLYNPQGDVIGLIDTSGNIVVEYKYDAWGKIIGRTGSRVSTLGYLNPFVLVHGLRLR